MKKINAFTLIELLAVIAILAIVMIIAVPTILNTVSTAKKGAFKDSVLGLLKSANNAAISDFDNMGEMEQYYINDTRLHIDNKVFKSGLIVRINEKYRLFNVSDGEYCANGDIENIEITQRSCKAEPTPETCFIFDKTYGGITGYKGITTECTDSVIIPNTIDGVPVTRIENNAFKSKGLTSVLLTKDILYVGDYAFANNKLTDNTYVVPSANTYQGAGYFNNNALNTEAFTYEPGSNNTVLIGYAGSSKVISIPEGVVKIASYAFKDLGLTNVDLPSTLKEIGNYAFYNNQLTSINLNNVEKIGEYAFMANQLKSLTIPESMKSISHFAFRQNSINNLVFLNNNVSYGYAVFNNNQLPDSQAFIYKPGTTNILISYGGAKRSGIVIPSNVTIITNYAFNSCSIQSVTIPEGVTLIDTHSFSTNLLTSITIPSTVKNINSIAFMSNNLSSITFMNINNITFGGRTFNNNKMPDDKAFIYDPKNPSRLVSYAGANRTNIVIPSNVKIIGDAAFLGTGLTSINIPEGVTTIEGAAFAENSIKTLTIPSTVTTIGNRAFTTNQLPDDKAWIYDPKNPSRLVSYGGANRTTVTVPSNVKTIANGALAYASIKNLIIPEGVTTIESSAAYWNPMETVSIPSTVTSIGSSAFKTSSNTFRSVKIAGDPTRFNSVWTSLGFPSHITPTN